MIAFLRKWHFGWDLDEHWTLARWKVQGKACAKALRYEREDPKFCSHSLHYCCAPFLNHLKVLLPSRHLNVFCLLFIELQQCSWCEISLELLALKTKHNEVCISKDSWLWATATKSIYEARREFAARFLGACGIIGSCRSRSGKWTGMSVCGLDRGGLEPAGWSSLLG